MRTVVCTESRTTRWMLVLCGMLVNHASGCTSARSASDKIAVKTADAGPDGASDEGGDASSERVVSGATSGRGGSSGASSRAGAGGTSAGAGAVTSITGASGASVAGGSNVGSAGSASESASMTGAAGAGGMSSSAGSGAAGAAGDKNAAAAPDGGAAGSTAMGSAAGTTGNAGSTGTAGASGDGASSDPAPVCGNGKVEAGEACDDGNTMPGDGCDASCKIERGGPAPGTGAGPATGSACQNLSDLCDVCSCAQCGGRRGASCSSLVLPARVNACNAVTACVRQSSCEIVNCYCGDNLASCLSGEPTGPCRMQIEQAVGSTEIVAIVAQLRDERSPIALAAQQVVCEQRQCAGVCQ